LTQVKSITGGITHFLSSYSDYFLVENVSGGSPGFGSGSGGNKYDVEFLITLKPNALEKIRQLWEAEVEAGRVSKEESAFIRDLQVTKETLLLCEKGTRPSNSRADNAAASRQLSNFSSMTVVELKNRCRELDLKVSGHKADLVNRLMTHNVAASEATDPDEMKVERHLISALKDIVIANGGTIGSRDAGRYLSRVQSSSDRGSSALQDLKSFFVSLNKFLARNTGTFVADFESADPTSSEGFAISLVGSNDEVVSRKPPPPST